ncbi:MAG: D-alanine--D-alanine ligase family protein [Rhizomicrobium sp.]
MHIAVTYDLRKDYLALGYSEEETAEFDSDLTVEALCGSLSALGYEPVRIGNIRALVMRLAAGERWDAAFNICEGLKGVSREAQVPALLEAYDIPYVFSDPLTLALSLDKAMAKRVVASHGVPTADFAVIEQEGEVDQITLPYPLFAKPVAEGSGKGVDAHSLVRNRDELAHTVRELFRRFQQPVLVETYLSGREFTVGITGTGALAEVLGVTEIRPLPNYVGHGYGLANKETGWEDKVEILLADPANAAQAAEVALAAWRALRCRDGGRVDIRCDGAGKHHFIEVNPLAGIRPHHSDLCLMADKKGISYRELISRIMASFEQRQPHLKRRAAA